MADYPYAMGIGKIPQLFQTVGEKGVPAKVTQKWLEQFGMSSSNDRRLIPILRFIGFIDDNYAPAQRWKDFRGADSRRVMAEAIRDGYSEVFQAYPDAETATSEQLIPFFRANTNLGDEAIRKAVSTFKALVGLADFTAEQQNSNAVNGRSDGSQNGADPTGQSGEKGQIEFASPRTNHSPIVINVNLQLTLPESDNPAVYDTLFASLNKHVLMAGSDKDA